MAQDLRALGLAGTLGMGIAGLSGGGAEYRGRVPGNPFSTTKAAQYLVLGINMGAGFQVTDRLSVGATMTLGTGFEQLGFVGPIISSAMVNAYALRGTVGVDYELNDCNTVGFYYQSKMSFDFPDAVRVGSPTYQDVNIAQPTTFGLGIANRSLMDGNLLLAADVYYKLWEDAALWQDMMVNQWALAVGAQLTRGNMKYRVGYSYNSNPINHSVGSSFDGIAGVGADAIQLYQASMLPFVNQHRITGGIGRQDLLFRGSTSTCLPAGCCRRATTSALTTRPRWRSTTSAWA